MVKKIYLLGGGNQEVYGELDKKILEEADNKNVFVINLTTNDKEKLERKKTELKEYFIGLGAEKVDFVSDFVSIENIRNKMNESGLLFIAGGNTEILLESLEKKKLIPLIKSFDGIIEGNSAGAYICCKKYLGSNLGFGLNLVDISCRAHYGSTDEKFGSDPEETLVEFSKGKEIYAMTEGSALIVEGENLSVIGDVYLFKNGDKRRFE